MNKIAIVVPIYKERLTQNELLSLRSLETVLGSRDIYFVGPESLDLTNYKSCFSLNFQMVPFSEKYFRSIAGYSRLLLQPNFYLRFIEYSHILIYQLDCVVFEDRLDEFARTTFSYIGAPWLESIDIQPFSFRYSKYVFSVFPFINKPLAKYVGNGGLSLRKVEDTLYLLKEKWFQRMIWGINEDAFFSFFNIEGYKTADLKTALSFSWEQDPKSCYDLCNGQRPMGLHAWEKYDLKFLDEKFQIFALFGY